MRNKNNRKIPYSAVQKLIAESNRKTPNVKRNNNTIIFYNVDDKDIASINLLLSLSKNDQDNIDDETVNKKIDNLLDKKRDTDVSKRRKWWKDPKWLITIIIPFVIYFLQHIEKKYSDDNNNTNKTYKEIKSFPDQEEIESFIKKYRDITNVSEGDNEFWGKSLYASKVERYYNSYNIDKDSVMKLFRKSRRIDKNSAIEPESIRSEHIDSNSVMVFFKEYYQRKNKIYHLEKHFVLDKDYKIISEWDSIID